MRAFTRLFSVATLVLSLGFAAQALPYEAKTGALVAREDGVPATFGASDPFNSGVIPFEDDISRRAADPMMLLTTMSNDVDVLGLKLKSASTPEDAKAVMGIVVTKLKACAQAGLGATPVADKTKAATVLFHIFQVVVGASAEAFAKFGSGICPKELAQLDAAFLPLLLTSEKAFGGLIQIVSGLAAQDPTFIANVNALGFKLVPKALGLA
ncbi:hypothetical protein FS749_006545 [Ceratobasidium sp. UAMH 11750]|nr:hypothetical protein FS749_006545 [Ceratobasidium sp. UAMH 11750]